MQTSKPSTTECLAFVDYKITEREIRSKRTGFSPDEIAVIKMRSARQILNLCVMPVTTAIRIRVMNIAFEHTGFEIFEYFTKDPFFMSIAFGFERAMVSMLTDYSKAIDDPKERIKAEMKITLAQIILLSCSIMISPKKCGYSFLIGLIIPFQNLSPGDYLHNIVGVVTAPFECFFEYSKISALANARQTAAASVLTTPPAQEVPSSPQENTGGGISQ